MSRCMRATLTLDDDVAAILERLRKRRDASLKDLVNEALRRGTEGYDRSDQKARAFADAISRAWPAASCKSRQHWRSPRRCRGRSLQVILVDANILIYAHVSSFAQHPAVRGWLSVVKTEQERG